MKNLRASAVVLCLLVVTVLVRCNDGNTTGNTSTTTTSALPAAAITVSGNGDIAVHPSAVAGFAVAIEFPIRIQETGGGTAIWNFFRVSYFLNGVEVERSELGADTIQSGGYRNIGARATMAVEVIARSNSTDFDEIRITMGFTDNRDARNFEQTLSLAAFDGVVIDLTPALIPEGSSFAIVESSSGE
jgi:hypothetical protein